MIDDRENNAVTQHRLQMLEEGIKDLRTVIEKSVGTLGGQMTALQTTLVAFQQELPKSYTPRPEAEERHKGVNLSLEDMDRRIGENRERIVRLENLGWAFVVGLVTTLGTAVIALLRTQPGSVP